ncbi:MAG: leucine-rich repeat protein [Lachnospiraceae bacterium]|nr:leucine-rich repeat protein [Lachnospiraceae bacterium]
MKKKITKILGLLLSGVMAVSSIQVPVMAEGIEENGEVEVSIDMVSVSEDGMADHVDSIGEDSIEAETSDGMSAEKEQESVSVNGEDEDMDYHFTSPEINLFEADVKEMTDEEISHMILSADEMNVKAWISMLGSREMDVLLGRNTVLSQTVDVYEPDENGECFGNHFDTYMDYLNSIEEKAGYKFTSTSGHYYINWYSGTTSEGQSVITVSGMNNGDSDNTQQSGLTWKVTNAKHGLALKAGCTKSWPNNLTSAQNKTNYQQVWADFTYTKPVSYTASLTYDAANNGSGNYGVYQGLHDSATGCLKKNTGAGSNYYISAGTSYTGTSTYTTATTETFNIGPNFTNLGCTDSATNNCVVARITLNPVYMGITWNQNGGAGSNCQPASVLYGNTHGQATAPTRAGYTFAGWSGYSATAAVTANKTYTAAWNANQYTITYDGAGGNLSKTSDKVSYSGSIPAMPSASRDGYTFNGWTWSGYSGSGEYNYVGNSTATASWKPNQYTISYDANGGKVSPTSNGVTYDQSCPTAPTPTRYGYTFTGWTGGTYTGTYKTAGNTTVKANWSANEYTIHYDGAGGELSKDSDTATFDAAVPEMPEATRTGYTLTDWTWNGYSGSGNYDYAGQSTARANWKANQYTIYYDADGGSVSPASNAVTFDQACPTAPVPTRKGYTFTGWEGGTYNGIYKTEGDTTVKAGWKPNTYTVSFNTDGGDKVEEMTATYDQGFLLPFEPNKYGYVFTGWSNGTELYQAGEMVKNLTAEQNGFVTLKAEWARGRFVIHFESNGGSEVSDIQYDFGDSATLPVPSRGEIQDGDTVTKYTFAGWVDEYGKLYTTAQDVTREVLPVNGTLTLTARWDESISTVTEKKSETREVIETHEKVVEQPVYETNNYTNIYGMTDEQAQDFLNKLMKGFAADITIKGIRFEAYKNADGSVTIRLIDLGNSKEVVIPDSFRFGDTVIPVTVIDSGAFKGNTTIERVVLGKNVTTIRESAFEGCTSLRQITFNDGLVTVERRAFFGCSSLKEIKTSKDLKSIGESAFENCTSLSKVTLNNGFLEIGAKAFRNCKSLKTFTIPASVLKIGDQAFEKCIKLSSIKFAAGSELQSIGKSAFAGCTALKSVKLPNKLTTLSDKAFYGCKKLSKVTGGKGLVTIGAKVFMNCVSLKKITLYKNVVTVGKQAFYGCKKLQKVTIKSKVLTKVGAKAFKKTHKNVVFYVPDKAKKDAYKKLLKGKF